MWACAGVACFLCHLPTLPLACFPAPYPPTPLPQRGRGRFFVFLCKGLRPLHPRDLNPRGTGSAGVSSACGGARGDGCLLTLPSRHPAGGLLSLPPADHAFSFLLYPLSPRPLPQRGRGRLKVYFAGGSAPGTPALNRLRHLQNLPYKYPAAEIRGLPQNRQEAVPYEQCRQPRRGGTGGDGTIRRTRRRRLRWSSPPGQIEQVPRWLAFFVARRSHLSLAFLPPIPPAPFPGGEGETLGYFMQGAAPLASPGVEPGRHWSRGANLALAGGCPALPTRLAAAVSGGGLAPTFFFPCLDRRGGL